MSYAPLILVVEDDPHVRGFIIAGLSSQDRRVVDADRAATALSLAASHVPDVIIPDLDLPDRDGIDVISVIRQPTRTQPFEPF